MHNVFDQPTFILCSAMPVTSTAAAAAAAACAYPCVSYDAGKSLPSAGAKSSFSYGKLSNPTIINNGHTLQVALPADFKSDVMIPIRGELRSVNLHAAVRPVYKLPAAAAAAAVAVGMPAAGADGSVVHPCTHLPLRSLAVTLNRVSLTLCTMLQVTGRPPRLRQLSAAVLQSAAL
jgi:hypothetical protein